MNSYVRDIYMHNTNGDESNKMSNDVIKIEDQQISQLHLGKSR